MDPNRSSRATVAALLAGGGALLAVHVARYGLPAPGGEALAGGFALEGLAGVARTLAGLAALNLCAASLGALVERALPVPTSLAPMRGVLRMGLGLGATAVIVLALAALGALTAPALAALLVGAPVAWLAVDRVARPPGAPPRAIPRPDRRTLLWLAGGGALLAGGFLRALADAPGWDALTYHLAFPARYLDENAIVMTPFSHLSGYVASTEMLYLLALALDGTPLAVLLHFEFGVLCVWAVTAALRDASPRAAAIGALILLADPLFQQELGWAYSDLSLALYVTLAATALAAWRRDPTDRAALVHAAIACGLACATRYLGITFAVALAAVVWAPPRTRRIAENLRAGATLAAVSLGVMLPWLIRNAVHTGNPFTPLLQSVFHATGEEYVPPIVMEQSTAFLRAVGMGRDPLALLALPWNLVVESVPGTYAESFGAQVGPLGVIGVVAALALPAVRRTPLATTLLFTVGLGTLLWFYSFQEARFLLPLFPLAAILGGLALDRGATLAPPWGRALIALPVAGALYTQLLLWPTVGPAFGAAFAGEGARPERGSVAAARRLRETLQPGDRLFLWLEERAYLFRGLDWVPYHIGSGSPALAFVDRHPHGAALHCGLQAMGVTHVLVNDNFRLAAPGLFVGGYDEPRHVRNLKRVSFLLRDEGEPLFERDGVRVYRLPPTDCPEDRGAGRRASPSGSRVGEGDDRSGHAVHGGVVELGVERQGEPLPREGLALR